MIGLDRWEEIRRRADQGASIRAIARELHLDRKTVRRCLRQTEWKPYERMARSDTLLATHAEYLRRRAAEVGYSAQVLFQELRGRRYRGSYETGEAFRAAVARDAVARGGDAYAVRDAGRVALCGVPRCVESPVDPTRRRVRTAVVARPAFHNSSFVHGDSRHR